MDGQTFSGTTQARANHVHIVGRFDSPFPGAERGLAQLATQLRAQVPVTLWADSPGHPVYGEGAVRVIATYAGRYPTGGTLVVAGTHVTLGPWVAQAKFSRVIVYYNLALPGALFAQVEELGSRFGVEVEVAYASASLKLSTGLPGAVVYSPINAAAFPIKTHEARSHCVIGRMSRDEPEKFHADDASVYAAWCAQGHRVRLMGATCQRDALVGIGGVEMLPHGAEDMAAFYQSLDIFFYRTGAWVETYGRVVAEAMANGLPVVVARRGGYAELIVDGENGYLFDTNDQAVGILTRLGKDAGLRQRIGSAARASMLAHEARYGESSQRFFTAAQATHGND
jgi:glycosyltransferase involved in cell wall biosynthesis